MSKRTTIYVLFKEYLDLNGRDKSSPYINDSDDYLADADALMNDWREVSDVLGFFGYEMANRFYDEENLAGLLFVADTIPEEYPSVSSIIMSEVMSLGLTSWRTDAAVKTNTYYYGDYDVTNDLLGDMAQRESEREAILKRIQLDTAHELLPKESEYEPCVLLQKGALDAPLGEIQITMTGGQRIGLKTVESIKDLHAWLSKHRFPCRHYTHNPKHGDAHFNAKTYRDRSGHVEYAAQLLTTKEETDSLLNKAIGHTVKGDLWYFDQSNECYIYFENQGDTPQHEYHAYHLHPGEKNYEKIDFKKIEQVI